MAPRRAVEQELTREIIMEAARELFVDEGYRSVSIRKIARKLQYSHGAIYYHFKNKAALFYALVDQDFAMLNQELDRIIDLSIPSEEKIKTILFGYIEFGLTHQNHYEIMFLIKDAEIQSCLEQEPNTTYEKFAQALYKLAEKPLHARKIWSVFLMLHGFVAHYCYSGQHFNDVKDLAKTYVEDIYEGILQ